MLHRLTGKTKHPKKLCLCLGDMQSANSFGFEGYVMMTNQTYVSKYRQFHLQLGKTAGIETDLLLHMLVCLS